MKRLLMMTVAAVIALGTTAAFALPPIPPMVLEHFGKDPNGAKIVETLKAQTGKCAMCHIPDADKKAKGHGLNDFGKAVHDNFKHKDFTAETKIIADNTAAEAAKAAAKAKAMTILGDALKKASELKNAKGEVFGDLIKEGKMPGDNTKK
jgi:hypothetical protein